MAESIPKITIVLPVYNVGKYLRKCLYSIAMQTFRDFVLIAVDDGATDDCPQILDDFAKKHPWCRVVHQENQGLSGARNTGLALAQSEYIAFLDSDDYIEPDFLEKLYTAAERADADIACCFHYYYFPEFGKNILHPFRCAGVFTREQALRKLLQDLQIQSYVWNKLYRRKLFTEHGITYPKMCFEDMATTHKLFYYANRVVCIPDLLYHYTQQKTSLLKTPNHSKINDFLRATASMRVTLEGEQDFPRYRKAFRALCRKTNFYADYYLLKIHLQNRTLKKALPEMRRVRRQLEYYQTKQFPAKDYVGKPVTELPAPLQVPQLKA